MRTCTRMGASMFARPVLSVACANCQGLRIGGLVPNVLMAGRWIIAAAQVIEREIGVWTGEQGLAGRGRGVAPHGASPRPHCFCAYRSRNANGAATRTEQLGRDSSGRTYDEQWQRQDRQQGRTHEPGWQSTGWHGTYSGSGRSYGGSPARWHKQPHLGGSQHQAHHQRRGAAHDEARRWHHGAARRGRTHGGGTARWREQPQLDQPRRHEHSARQQHGTQQQWTGRKQPRQAPRGRRPDRRCSAGRREQPQHPPQRRQEQWGTRRGT